MRGFSFSVFKIPQSKIFSFSLFERFLISAQITTSPKVLICKALSKTPALILDKTVRKSRLVHPLSIHFAFPVPSPPRVQRSESRRKAKKFPPQCSFRRSPKQSSDGNFSTGMVRQSRYFYIHYSFHRILSFARLFEKRGSIQNCCNCGLSKMYISWLANVICSIASRFV